MGSTSDAIREAITGAMNVTHVQVTGGDGGHFHIVVTSGDFEGKSTLERHRMVLNSIAPLMSGPNAPVHAIDSLKATTS